MKKYIVSIMLLVLAGPSFASAYSTELQTAALNYQPRTNAEMIAYLYGRISQLLEIKKALEYNSTAKEVDSALKYVEISTKKATDVTSNSAILRAEVVLYNEQTANVWFEYGQDPDFLDQRTNWISIKSVYDRAVRIKVTGLEDDERYYFRIVSVDKNKIVQYGEVYGFRTDEL